MTKCIRRPGSVWTLCTCDDCRRENARTTKLHRNGLRIIDDQRHAAQKRLEEWCAAGYSVGVISAMTGIRVATISNHVTRGRHMHIHHSTATRIMAADPTPVGGGFIPSTGTWRRLRALTAMGWSMPDLAARCDITATTLHALRDPKHATTRPRFAEAVRRLYDELGMTPGPCRYAATRAKRLGWAPPLAWDEGTIDDPTALPDTGQAGLSWEKFTLDDLDDLASWGHDRHSAARRLGVSVSAIEHRCSAKRANRPDLLERLDRNALAREAS